jgi:putative transposase
MEDYQSLCHTKWVCKYHIVWIPKCRKKTIYGAIRKELGEAIRELAHQRESKILEGHLMIDHVHILIEIPPKYAISQVVGYIKGKSAIHISRNYEGRQRNFTGQSFWARGYYVSTVGMDEETIREYIRNQENDDRKQDELNFTNN